ncbi:hypothetical protein Q4Q34_06360 [Flavivirga abyssicola]|uniref:hypothetical protein n=1 Tax=Flavivirga abyssicola TaxID=3063533 RepID=UPI0026DFB3E7|nr:hypothetical protein [Flavivirga sp. MEBiC07777]WVK14650.1 hypothetical protein Q4Q34_06360 [Flavivirga sp. MEBiC07777]
MKYSIKNKNSLVIIFICFLSILITLEILSALFAYETIGEVTSGFYVLMIFLNIIPILLFILKRKLLSFFITIIIGAILIPGQILLGHKLFLLKNESASVVNYIYKYKIRNGKYPVDISEYRYKYPELRNHITYNFKDTDFSVYYYVSTPNTFHYYVHSRGYNWGYYPD